MHAYRMMRHLSHHYVTSQARRPLWILPHTILHTYSYWLQLTAAKSEDVPKDNLTNTYAVLLLLMFTAWKKTN